MGRTIKNIQTDSSKRKKRLKWILIGLWLIIGFGLLRRFFAMFLDRLMDWRYYSGNLILISWIFSILLPLFTEILIIYIIILLKARKYGGNNTSKKYLKISLIVLLPFLLVSAFAFFTKVEIIPNRFNVELLTPAERYDRLRVIGGCNNGVCYDKPIIYLYPTRTTKIHVELGTPENLSHTYPKYNSGKGRNVIAQQNGDLEDIETGRKLYALYREGKFDNETNFDEGFVVAGKDIIPFLEEKLAILGLNEREAEEFIVYRLPQMENNEWNLIRFETKTEQDENMPLNIIPTPDTVIRIMMDWKAINEPIDIPEQQLTTPERNGFTVVEWGGSPRN